MERNAKTGNRKELGREKSLFWLLGGLAVLAMVLVVVIVVVAVNNGNKGGETIGNNDNNWQASGSKYLENVEIGGSEAEQQAAACLQQDGMMEIVSCIDEATTESEWLDEDTPEEALERAEEVYQATVEILRQGDYYTEMVQLLSAQAIRMASNGDCVGALGIFNETDLKGFSDLNKAVWYGNAIGVAETCQNSTAVAKFTELRDQMMEEVENAVYN